jgi:hypothetical protein
MLGSADVCRGAMDLLAHPHEIDTSTRCNTTTATKHSMTLKDIEYK